MIYQRSSGRLVETSEYGAGKLRFLYGTIIGRMLLRVLVSRLVSQLYGAYNRSGLSARKINRFVRKYSIATDEFCDDDFQSFNDFFIRKLKASARPFSKGLQDFISVADSKLQYYQISDDLQVRIKGSVYTIGEIVKDQTLAASYAGGTCLVFRLSIDDCHRYIFPDDGSILWTKHIPGLLHTVQPIAHQTGRPYARNTRVVSCLQTDNFGQIIYIEIGALLVGAIHNHEQQSFSKGAEKGYFELGGSTIVVLLKPGEVQIDDDIVQYSHNDTETAVKHGETIGRKRA